MFCNHCGAQLPEGSVFCNACGKSLREETPPQPQSAPPAWQAPITPPQPPRPQPAPKAKGSTMWWVFAGISIFLLVVSLAFLSVRGLLSLASDGENDLWLPEYVPPVVSTAPDLEPSDDPWNVPDEPSDDPWSTPDDPDDWNADGSWVLGANYLYGEWVSDLYSDGTVECLYFDDDGYVELWEGLPGSAGDDIDTWYDGDWEKTLLYSGSYWVDGDYLTLEFEDSHATYYVDMVSLFDIDVYFDDGSVTHFEQVSW